MRMKSVAMVIAAMFAGSSALGMAANEGARSSSSSASAANGGMADGLPYNKIEVSPEGVEYVTGGIGTEAQQRLNARADDFNLKLVFSLEQGAYIADVAVTIKDKQGRTVVEDVADGPYLMAQLPPGQYTVEARYDGKTRTRQVQVGKQGTRTAYMRWPRNPETDFIIAQRP